MAYKDYMCGRFAQKKSSKALKEHYKTKNALERDAARYNIAPSSPVVTIALDAKGERVMDFMRWGLVPSWAKDVSIGNKLINARAETIEEKPSFRNAFKRRRCVIPASGFYEWHTETREPYYFSSQEDIISLAGIWEHWQSPAGSELHTCAIVTTEANQLMHPIHHRMPVILKPEAVDIWLSTTEDPKLLKPLFTAYDDTLLRAWSVSKRVNSPANDGPELINPYEQGRLSENSGLLPV